MEKQRNLFIPYVGNSGSEDKNPIEEHFTHTIPILVHITSHIRVNKGLWCPQISYISCCTVNRYSFGKSPVYWNVQDTVAEISVLRYNPMTMHPLLLLTTVISFVKVDGLEWSIDRRSGHSENCIEAFLNINKRFDYWTNYFFDKRCR